MFNIFIHMQLPSLITCASTLYVIKSVTEYKNIHYDI